MSAQSRKKLLRMVGRGLVFYGLIPALLLWLMAKPVGDAARVSNTSVFLALLAVLGAVGLNWAVYALVRRKRPTLPVLAYGALCLMSVIIIEYEALPGTAAVRSTLAYLFMIPLTVFLLLLSFWFASRPSRPAHAASVGCRVVLWIILFGIAWHVARDIEIRRVTLDTWITVGIFIAMILGMNAKNISRALRSSALRRKATGLTAGTIVQIIGETRLDSYGDLVTRNYARVQYTVADTPYETRADITRFTTRRFGRESFVGREVPVRYDPADPARAFVNRIDKHVLDKRKDEESGTE